MAHPVRSVCQWKSLLQSILKSLKTSHSNKLRSWIFPIAAFYCGYFYSDVYKRQTQYGVPYMVFYFIAAMIIGIILLQYTTYGRKVYAIGGNHEAARYSGLNVRLVEMSVYVISGLCSGICGFLMASRISSGNANSADGYEMTVISAVVIGGVSMSGGVGTMTGVMIGVLITGVISNGMDILGVNSYYQKILQAVIILVAVYIDGKINRRKK